jgi:cellulose synthase (UDP-forming)
MGLRIRGPRRRPLSDDTAMADAPSATPRQPFYFERFEERTPPAPVPYRQGRERLWHTLGVASLVAGTVYIIWRWGWSLPDHALWFALPLVLAESVAYLGLILFYFDIWSIRDPPQRPPPARIGDCDATAPDPERPLAVDVFITTRAEDPELVRISIRDAKRIAYPYPLQLIVYVLDDGRRPSMAAVAREEGVRYMTRASNVGFKAGNLSHAMARSTGDFVLICDADTRPFSTILEHTLGYFRDPDVAWVQTPQWFYDLPSGTPLATWLGARLGPVGRSLGRAIEAVLGPIPVGADPFCSDSRMFFDVIQRRRNRAYASFCCGAGSIQRREALMQAALKAYARAVEKESSRSWRRREHETANPTPASVSGRYALRQAARKAMITPYVFHVSEDIYTSIVLHSDPTTRYRSIMHPTVESKMLSPQDLLSWSIQHFKYAGGTLDIALHDCPVSRRAMPWRSRLMYAATIGSYLNVFPNLVFLTAPIVYLFTGIGPIKSYSWNFALMIMPFLVLNEAAMMVGTWNVPTVRERAMRIGMFPLVLRALWTVVRRQPIQFLITPKERTDEVFPELVVPQMLLLLLTVVGWVYSLTRLAQGRWPADETAGLVVNGFWSLFNTVSLAKIVMAAWYRPSESVTELPYGARQSWWTAARGHVAVIAGLLLVTGVIIALD